MLGILHADPGPWTRMDPPAVGQLRAATLERSKAGHRANGKLPSQHSASLSRQMNHQ